MLICHRNPTDDRPNDSNESLIRPAHEQVLQMGRAIKLLLRSTVDRSIVVPGEATNRRGREHVRLDHMRSEIGHKTNCGFNGSVVRSQLFQFVLLF